MPELTCDEVGDSFGEEYVVFHHNLTMDVRKGIEYRKKLSKKNFRNC